MLHRKRIHKVVHGKDFSHFVNVNIEGDYLRHLDEAANDVNEDWPDYDEVCLETHSFDIHDSQQYDVPSMVILRAHVCCCCAPPCAYHEDHDLTKGGAFSNARRYNTGMMETHDKPHFPGSDYCESHLEMNALRPLFGEAAQRVPNLVTRLDFAKEISEEAALFELTADEIESHLGLAQTHKHGLLSEKGAVQSVLNGHSEVPDDYAWTAAFIILWQRLLHTAYNRLTKDWPQRHRIKESALHGLRVR